MTVRFNGSYLLSEHGICKIIQIISGFVVISSVCMHWYGGKSCFSRGRIGFINGLKDPSSDAFRISATFTFVLLVANTILFLINLANVSIRRLEHFFNIVAVISLALSIILIVWFFIQHEQWRLWRIVASSGIIVMIVLYIWDDSHLSRYKEHSPV